MTGPTEPAAAPASGARRRELAQRLLRQRQATSGGDGATAPVAGHPPEVSLFFFSADTDDSPADKYQLVMRCAELADELGLHAVWVPERHFDPFGAPYPAPAVLLAALAGRTRRIQLRAGSVVLPLHDPLLVAEEWGVLDAVSGGRVALSLASGWHSNDFVLDPEAYQRRKGVLLERLEVMRALWQGKSVTRTGPDGRASEVQAFPRPGRLPQVWLTSSGNPETWRTAGAHGLHVLTALLEQSVDEVAAKVALYREERARAGHLDGTGQVTCMLHTHVAADAGQVTSRVREPLLQYLSAHMNLFAKYAAAQDVGVRLDEVTEADRAVLLEHGLQRYLRQAGLFGSVDTCLPMVDRLAAAGVTELGCLVDFGLPDAQVIECVQQLGQLRQRLHRRQGGG